MKKISVFLFSVVLLMAGKVIVSLDWDPSAIREFEGRITAKKGFYFVLDVNGKNYYLQVAPPMYLQRKGVVLDLGSKIWVKGMVVRVNDDHYIFAKEIKVSGKKILIRNDEGVPYWRIERRRRRGVRNNRNSFR